MPSGNTTDSVGHIARASRRSPDARGGTHCDVWPATKLTSAQSDMFCPSQSCDPQQVDRSLGMALVVPSASASHSSTAHTVSDKSSGVSVPPGKNSVTLPGITSLLALCSPCDNKEDPGASCGPEHNEEGEQFNSMFSPHATFSGQNEDRTLPMPPLLQRPMAGDHHLMSPATEAPTSSDTRAWMDQRAPSSFLSTRHRLQVWNGNLYGDTRHYGASRIDSKYGTLFEMTQCAIKQRLLDYYKLTTAEVCYAKAVVAYGSMTTPDYKSRLPVKLVALYGSCHAHNHEMEQTGLGLLEPCGVEGVLASPAQNSQLFQMSNEENGAVVLNVSTTNYEASRMLCTKTDTTKMSCPWLATFRSARRPCCSSLHKDLQSGLALIPRLDEPCLLPSGGYRHPYTPKLFDQTRLLPRYKPPMRLFFAKEHMEGFVFSDTSISPSVGCQAHDDGSATFSITVPTQLDGTQFSEQHQSPKAELMIQTKKYTSINNQMLLHSICTTFDLTPAWLSKLQTSETYEHSRWHHAVACSSKGSGDCNAVAVWLCDGRPVCNRHYVPRNRSKILKSKKTS